MSRRRDHSEHNTICTATATQVSNAAGKIWWIASSVGTARTIQIRDGGATDNIVWSILQKANSTIMERFNPPFPLALGMRVEISGAGAKVNVAWE